MTAGLLLGLAFGAGAILLLLGAPPLRRPSLADRLAPFLADAPVRSRLLDEEPALRLDWAGRLVAPFLRDAARLLDRALGGVTSTRRRLEHAGLATTVEEFRVEQVVWGAVGLLAGLCFAALVTVRRGTSPLPLLVLALAMAVGGVLGRDRWLSAQVSRREQRILAEFPVIADLLALAVSAGESPAAAIDRAGRLSHGELAVELTRTTADMHAGSSLTTALERLRDRTSVPVLARFADAVAVAVERGTPLAEVLRGQALDVRDASRRALMEVGGRKEIAMLMPVVFLVLPVTVVFALFPGLAGLDLTA